MKFEVKGFQVLVSGSGNFVQNLSSNNALFTAEQKQMIASRKKDDLVIIKDIKAVGPDGIVRQLNSITFTVK